MVKLSILFFRPTDTNSFEERYNASLALLEQMPNLRRRQACVVLGSPSGHSPYYRILELYFDDFGHLDAAMTSPEGQAAGRHLMTYAHSAELVFSEVYED
jgi:uncharacterized protein (TIGR02118 family)